MGGVSGWISVAVYVALERENLDGAYLEIWANGPLAAEIAYKELQQEELGEGGLGEAGARTPANTPPEWLLDRG